jgi:2,4-dienoyl-CoA reductase-like NADH-dependent reductase (Old Yellow Enzyme family)
MTQLAQLFEPLTVGHMQVRNRIMMPGMSAGMMLDSDAQANPEMIAYYAERAKARPGLMAIGASQVVPPAGPHKQPLALYHDRFIFVEIHAGHGRHDGPDAAYRAADV